mmetsp:Transcript_74187/g.214946  ORF Transcript_74187/g.214946 Transcript_74187/m.214946 type:complete len:251 (+) Transcript_74187:454-1206(+)
MSNTLFSKHSFNSASVKLPSPSRSSWMKAFRISRMSSSGSMLAITCNAARFNLLLDRNFARSSITFIGNLARTSTICFLIHLSPNARHAGSLCFGFLLSSNLMKSIASCDMSAQTPWLNSTLPREMRRASSSLLVATKGKYPLKQTKAMTPQLQISQDLLYLLAKTSGAMWEGVPAGRVSTFPSSTMQERPKSATLRVLSSSGPALSTKTLSAFMSRWHMLCLCRYSVPRKICCMTPAAGGSFKFPNLLM